MCHYEEQCEAATEGICPTSSTQGICQNVTDFSLDCRGRLLASLAMTLGGNNYSIENLFLHLIQHSLARFFFITELKRGRDTIRLSSSQVAFHLIA